MYSWFKGKSVIPLTKALLLNIVEVCISSTNLQCVILWAKLLISLVVYLVGGAVFATAADWFLIGIILGFPCGSRRSRWIRAPTIKNSRYKWIYKRKDINYTVIYGSLEKNPGIDFGARSRTSGHIECNKCWEVGRSVFVLANYEVLCMKYVDDLIFLLVWSHNYLAASESTSLFNSGIAPHLSVKRRLYNLTQTIDCSGPWRINRTPRATNYKQQLLAWRFSCHVRPPKACIILSKQEYGVFMIINASEIICNG